MIAHDCMHFTVCLLSNDDYLPSLLLSFFFLIVCFFLFFMDLLRSVGFPTKIGSLDRGRDCLLDNVHWNFVPCFGPQYGGKG